MSSGNSSISWVNGYLQRSEGTTPNTYIADYRLSDLIRKGYINPDEGEGLLMESGLEDFFWRVTWPEDYETPDEHLEDRIGNVHGYAVFVHGWTGNHSIWEELPGMTVMSNRRLVAISVDHNGFGKSSFSDVTPSIESCNPPAAMRTLQKFVDMIKIRRQPGSIDNKVINFIGHSMGGATLFYLNPILWRYGETTRYALSPALLLEDEMHKFFYSTLGLGIGILQRIPQLEFIERFIKPNMVKTLAAGASDFVKEEHSRQYEETPRGITGATFAAMGRLSNYEIARDWSLFRVMLGHRDPLVGLNDMMDLLCKLEFPASNIRVVAGTHYPFSIGSESPSNAFQHAQNRELVVEDIIALHKRSYEMQRKGPSIG